MSRRLGLMGHGDRPVDAGAGILGRKNLVLPDCDRLMLEHDAGRGADEPVGARQLRQGEADGGSRIGGRLMERLQIVPELPLGGVGRLSGICWRGRFGADVADAVELTLATAAAHGEVDRAVLADGHVGQRQRCPRDELCLRALVGRALGLDMNGIHRAERPVADVERPLILFRELRAVAEGRAHGRPWADIDQGRQAIGIAGGPLAGAAAPAEFAAAGRMVYPRGAIPRRSKIPFHVGVVDEEFAVGVEGHVVGIAVARAPDLPGLPRRIGADDIAARGEDADRMAAGVPHPRDEQIFV